jgi:hypothetical protein
MGKLKYLSGQNKNKNYSGIHWFFHVLPALEHHTYSEDDVEEGGIKIKKTNFLMKMAIF